MITRHDPDELHLAAAMGASAPLWDSRGEFGDTAPGRGIVAEEMPMSIGPGNSMIEAASRVDHS
jgi:hypothetical protein